MNISYLIEKEIGIGSVKNGSAIGTFSILSIDTVDQMVEKNLVF